jgi:hypothetical protein
MDLRGPVDHFHVLVEKVLSRDQAPDQPDLRRFSIARHASIPIGEIDRPAAIGLD